MWPQVPIPTRIRPTPYTPCADAPDPLQVPSPERMLFVLQACLDLDVNFKPNLKEAHLFCPRRDRVWVNPVYSYNNLPVFNNLWW